MTNRRHITFDSKAERDIDRLKASLASQGITLTKSATVRYALSQATSKLPS